MLLYILSTLQSYMYTWKMEKEEGQDMAEYALVLALIAVMLVGALGLLKGGIAGVFDDIVAAFG